MRLTNADDVDAARAKMDQHRAQKFRRDLEMALGLEFGVPAGADVVQHENGADAGEERLQQMMHAGQVKRSQSGANDGVSQLLNRNSRPVWMLVRNSRQSAKQTVSRQPDHRLLFPV